MIKKEYKYSLDELKKMLDNAKFERAYGHIIKKPMKLYISEMEGTLPEYYFDKQNKDYL